MFQMSLTSLGLLWRNLLKAPRCQRAQNTSGSCCRTRCSCSPKAAGPLQQFVWTSAMIQSQNPPRFSSFFSHPPLNEIKILTKPTGAIKASVKAGKRKQELQETFRGWRCRNWRCWGQGSSTGSQIQPIELWNPWAEQLPLLPLGTPRSPASCQGPKITQELWRAEMFQDTNDFALLRFAPFPNKNKILKSLRFPENYGLFFGQ